MEPTAVDPEGEIDRALALWLALVREDPALAEELRTSIGEFFGGGAPSGSPRETLLAARRHLEWFVLERHSPAAFGVPVERLAEAWRARAESDLAPYETSLSDSFAGVFEVTAVEADGRVWLADLAGLAEYALQEARGGAIFEAGDLIVGRLFPLPGGGYHVSRAAGVYRDERLREALAADLRRVRQQGGAVRHVAQRELEAMFFARDEAQEGDPVAEVRALLEDAGLAPERIQALLGRLAATPFDPNRLVLGGRDGLGSVLDELAFDTDVDLEAARHLLARAWARLARKLPVEDAAEAAQPVDPRAAVEAFEAGRRAGGDLEALLAALERDLCLEDVDDDDDPLEPAPDFPGVVGAMVDEFLWELGRRSPERAERFEVLRALGRFAARVGVYEDLGLQDLLRFTAFWIHEDETAATGAEALDLVDALASFSDWSERAHGHGLGFERLKANLERSLPRLVEANRAVAQRTPIRGEDPGSLYELVRVEADGTCELRDVHGEARDARLAPEVARWLRAGDRLRARLGADGDASVLRCYPAELAALEVA